MKDGRGGTLSVSRDLHVVIDGVCVAAKVTALKEDVGRIEVLLFWPNAMTLGRTSPVDYAEVRVGDTASWHWPDGRLCGQWASAK